MKLGAVLGAVLVLMTAAPAYAEAETYADYTMMFQRSAGQYAPADGAPGQWAWSPASPTESDISWGDPKAWPPDYAEHFVHAGDWVLLDGWRGNGTYYRLRVTKETYCAPDCVTLPSDGGRQHYARWNVPTADYRLEAAGTITEESSGKVFDFTHTQTWGAPATCHNQRFADRTCVTQSEAWADNRTAPGTPVRENLRRDVRIAKGLGMAFLIDNPPPAPWHAEATAYWNW